MPQPCSSSTAAMTSPISSPSRGRPRRCSARAFPHLEDLSDRDMIASALRERRVSVTENHRDFINLDSEPRREGLSHTDFILTSDRRYPRRHHAGVGRLVTALDAWLNE